MPQLGLFQSASECTVLPPVPLLIHQQAEAFLEAQFRDAGLLGLCPKGLGHSVQTHHL